MVSIDLVATLGTAPDPKAAILALDAAVKAKALAAEFDWGITRDTANKRYTIEVRTVRVRNLTTNGVVAQVSPNQKAAYFEAGKRMAPIQCGVGNLIVAVKAGNTEGLVYIDGKKLGMTPLNIKEAVGTINVQVHWSDVYSGFSQKVTVSEGQLIIVTASESPLKIGDLGPAGGIIFYDKGNVSDGWRYLEAASTDQSDQSTGILWSNGSYISIKTGTTVGTGKANTEAIIAAQGSGNYAATLCKNLKINDFSDWFLPSKEELDQMYHNLKKVGLGGFVSAYWYWSSSEYSVGNAWGQDFGSGGQGFDLKSSHYNCVRAVRAF
jgi:hypothetical protein